METVLGDAAAAFLDVALDHGVRPASTKEGSREVACAWSQIKQARLNRRGQTKAWVEHESNGSQERIPGKMSAVSRNFLGKVANAYIFQTKLEDARPIMRRFGYLNRTTILSGFTQVQIFLAWCFLLRP